MQHIIRKQNIQLTLHKKQDAFHIQHLFSEHYWHDVVPVLEKLFDEASTEDETIFLDTLELDLGVLTEKEISRKVWSDELLSALAKQFRENLKVAASGSGRVVQTQKKAIGICQQWLYYMQKGYLPWNALQINEEWRQKVLEALAADYASVTALRRLIQTDLSAVSRIVQQHTEAFLVNLIEILTAGSQQNLLLLLNELEFLYNKLRKPEPKISALHRSEIRKIFWRYILALSIATERKIDENYLVQSILDKYIGHPAHLPTVISEILPKLPSLLPILKAWEQKAVTVDKKNFIKKEAEEEDKPEISLPDNEKSIDEEGVFVQHAGLVILHPFLNTFFRRLLLVTQGKFADETAQQKALYLLHYLATGDIQAEEYALVMPKVLCAYPLQKPVDRPIHITHDEKEEASHLLEETIRQWEVLKNTSPNGLREGFLQRKGKLLTKNDHLYLQIEANAIDILLDHLPWNLTIIKLPWMQHMIRVEWR